ncbi:MAG TPA: M50 family metallopeptidase [Myxococcaceae bacterium]|nr:M50 family metallopeptidase [Myxococcaceae bacterium]
MAEASGGGGFRFALFRVPITIMPAFWIVTAILASTRLSEPVLLAEWALVVLVSVTVHELGHALVARRFGHTVRVELHGMGGTTYHQGASGLTGPKRAAISLAGPFAGVAFGGAVYALAQVVPPTSALAEVALRDALWVNLGYGLLNLLPILPLDGGHVLQEVVDAVTKRRNHPAATVISLVFAVGLFAVSLMLGYRWGLFLLGWLAITHAREGWEKLRDWRDRGLHSELEPLGEAYVRGDHDTVIRGAEEVLKKARGDAARAQAAHLLALAHFGEDRYAETLAALRQMPSTYRPDPRMYSVCCLKTGKTREAVEMLRRWWVAQPNPEVGALYAQALAADGQLNEAIAFVEQTPAAQLDAAAVNQMGHAAFQAGRFADSLRLCTRSFEQYRDPLAAYNAACAQARLNAPGEALRWLERAVDAGWKDAQAMRADEDLAPVRALPGFDALLRRMAERGR